jgi:hypothetical protein
MSTPKNYFQHQDLSDELPEPGTYTSRITGARFRRSAQGNRMLQVTYCLEGVSPPYDLLCDYFVIEGASPHGVSLGRRRLVQLYRACGFQPKEGEEISPRELVEARVRVRVEHDEWEAQPRLRIIGYQSWWSVEPEHPRTSLSVAESETSHGRS